MRTIITAAGLGGLLVLVGAARAVAHHSFSAEFDINRPIQLTGTVAKVEWINPHAWIHVDVKKPDGTIETWAIETGTPNTKYSGNKKRSTFKEQLQRSDILPRIESGLSTSLVFATCFRCSCALDGLRKFRCHSPILHRRMRSK